MVNPHVIWLNPRQLMRCRPVRQTALLWIVLSAAFSLVGCHQTHPGPSASRNLFTCAMHPSVRTDAPGNCPICGMPLVAVNALTQNRGSSGAAESPAPAEEPVRFNIPLERQQRFGVTYALATRRTLAESIRATGFLAADATRTYSLVARMDGYVENLVAPSAGVKVARGDTLLTMFAPELRSREQELVNLLNATEQHSGFSVPATSLVDAAVGRLKLLNLSEEDIAELSRSRQISDRLVLRSPCDGIVTEVSVHDGVAVRTGDRLVSLLNLETLWLWLDVPAAALGYLQEGMAVQVWVESSPAKPFAGRIVAIDPTVNETTRTIRARVDLANPDLAWRPGLFAEAELMVDLGEQLAVPVEAVLPGAAGPLVFVGQPSGGIQPRLIRVGSRAYENGRTERTFYSVLEGLREGDRVVASANFIVDAEAKLQGLHPDEQPIVHRGSSPDRNVPKN